MQHHHAAPKGPCRNHAEPSQPVTPQRKLTPPRLREIREDILAAVQYKRPKRDLIHLSTQDYQLELDSALANQATTAG